MTRGTLVSDPTSQPQDENETDTAIDEAPADDTTEGDEQLPSTEELEEPSTEKAPGEEPTSPAPASTGGDEPSHRAVGIGVIDDDPPTD